MLHLQCYTITRGLEVVEFGAQQIYLVVMVYEYLVYLVVMVYEYLVYLVVMVYEYLVYLVVMVYEYLVYLGNQTFPPFRDKSLL